MRQEQIQPKHHRSAEQQDQQAEAVRAAQDAELEVAQQHHDEIERDVELTLREIDFVLDAFGVEAA